MTTTALHQSEITFTCPPWCIATREEHLQDLSEHGGCVEHVSASTEGDSDWLVQLTSMTYPDGTPADPDGGTQVGVDASMVFMSPAEARRLVQALIAATAEAER